MNHIILIYKLVLEMTCWNSLD